MQVKTLEDYVNSVNYDYLNNVYVPSVEAIQFVNFIKLVNGSKQEEHKTPVIHLHMIDAVIHGNNNLFVVFRGAAKTTVIHEYMFLYLAVYGRFFSWGEVKVAMYISDTMENGIKNMREQLEFRWRESAFLQEFIPITKFTDDKWEFTNADGKRLFVRGFAAMTGVRGFKKYGERPTWCGLDDLLSDKNAKSPTIMADIENVVYKASRQAMHPTKRKICWTGTPFSQKDSLYKAAGSSGWNTNAYPVCERFPCTKEEFKGAWEERFTYEFLDSEYKVLASLGKVADFDQELMLRITSEEDRLIKDSDICWYNRGLLLQNKEAYNFYITTDFATSEKESADFSVISVWAYNNKGYWFLVDGVCVKQTMDKNIDDLFRLAQLYNPQSVGVEVSGQQGGFIKWIQEQMLVRNIWFNLASDNNNGAAGIRPVSQKLVRFQTIVPWFKSKIMFFPEDLRGKDPLVIEAENELKYLTLKGFKSLHDDWGDTAAMLSVLKVWKPSETTKVVQDDSGIWEDSHIYEDEGSQLSRYIV